ncbi:hypothetical protein ABZ330_19830 [Streptomyces sp. NPDC006172]|uniref:hypothetical protein n=1 Tax=Streptomyces sp. NPDC006172 TaxID=3154470 RepID=UPI0033CC3684
MSPRTAQRAPKGRDRDRADRRAVVDVLLARAQRGVLSPAEGALLAQHVREEQRVADENRRAMAGTTRALAKHREAADAEIRQLEGDRDRLARDVEAMHDGINATAREAYAQRRQHRDALAEQRARVDQVLAVLARVRNAQSLGDALAAVAEHDGLSPAAARLHARILDRADSTEARLAEQQREHDVALAVAERSATASERAAEQHRRALAAVLARPAGTPFAELTEYAAKTLTRAGERILDAEHRATRYRTAWFAARRDRRADRAAMAAELPLAQAVERVRALAERMRAGSPQGAAAIYADRIEQALAVDNEHQEQHA